MKQIEERIGYRFRDPELLRRALTHSSYANERGWGRAGCNERLEFLGDSILGYFTAEYLFGAYPDKPEGEMTKLRAELVCEHSLARVAERLSLGKALLLGRGEELGGGRGRPSITADAVEALLAAVYLDGGFEAAVGIIRRALAEDLHPRMLEDHLDAKSRLQEILQRTGEMPRYEFVSMEGPPHAPVFRYRAVTEDRALGEGTGSSKQQAQQEAARDALRKLGRK